MNISRERLRQLRQNAFGLCKVAACRNRKTRGKSGMCAHHRDDHATKTLARYHEGRKGKRQNKCGKCGGHGHNSRRCGVAS